MKVLKGRLLQIATGQTDLPPEEVSAYRAEFARRGYQVPDYSHAQQVGDILSQSLSWIEKIKPENATCTCKTLAKEMNNDGPATVRRRRDSYYVPRMMENKTAISEAMKAVRGWTGVLGLSAGLMPDRLVIPWIAGKIDAACVESEKLQAPTRSKAVGFSSAFKATGTPRFVTAAQLQHDIKTLAGKLPPDVTAIAGVARSGLAVATMVSMYLHLPMLTIRQNSHDIQETGNGWRLGRFNHVKPNAAHICVIDDTCMTGNSLKAITPLVKTLGRATTATVYCNPLARTKPDIFAVELGWPHLLEWNLFNSVLSPNMATDFDGVLCRDCYPGEDDDGERYLNFIRTAEPNYLSRKVPIPLIVTARIEKYREETLAWLARQQVQCRQLVMHPATTLQERNRDNIAAFKARHFEQWASQHKRQGPPPLGFIESEDWQAREIAKTTGRMVICPATAGVY